ncbi:MAG: hypothetical protein U9P10_12145 [Thermodesulfobacteriota bacterium]|nr:hypothetical protein [Thermodesulfobacteriota bacterium]
MKNVTITLEEDVADWVRIKAAKNRISVSRWTGFLLKEKKQDEAGYRQTMNQFFSSPPVLLKKDGQYPSRNDLHER